MVIRDDKSTRHAQVEGILSLLLQAWEESQAAEAAREAEEAQLFKTKPRVADMTSQEARGLTVECMPVKETHGWTFAMLHAIKARNITISSL